VIALLYDIHGNLPALEAVAADARKRGATQWFLGGDYAAFGAWPAETLARLEELEPAVWIRGNWERWLGGDDADMPAVPFVRGAKRFLARELPASVHEQLFALPLTHRRSGSLYCHGSPRSDMEAFLPEDGPEDEVFLGPDAPPRIVFGHTHLQFHRKTPDGHELINPGSVGLPFDGDPRAAYALLPTGVGEVQLHRVAYDHEASAAALRAIGEPWAEEVATMLVKAGR
jgi:diadenosine tetraphosphatase ApaH/serine/threonine PP2A family protein phosphatase